MKKMTKNGSKVTKVAAAATVDNKATQAQVQVVDFKAGNIPPALNDAQVTEITDQCVKDLNVQQDSEAQSWIEKGRLVAEFVKKIAPTLSKKTNCYDILAAHPDSTLQSQQLRYFHACADLYNKMGGEGRAPNLKMTAFVCVLPKKLTISDKMRLLEQAETEDLSIAQLKDRVKLATDHSKPESKSSLTPEINKLVNKFESQSKGILATLSAIKENTKPEAPLTDEVKKLIADALNLIFDFAKTHGYSEVSLKQVSMKKAA